MSHQTSSFGRKEHTIDNSSHERSSNHCYNHSFCSKLPYIILGGAAVATGIALYILNSSDEDDTAIATLDSHSGGLALFTGFLAAGQALLTNAAAQMRMPSFNSQNDHSDSIARMRKREFEYLTSVSPLAVSEYDDDDTNSVSLDDDDFFDAIEEQQDNKRSYLEKRGETATRELMSPKTDEYMLYWPINPITRHDSLALNDGNIAYTWQDGWLGMQIKDETGYTLYSYAEPNLDCINPSLALTNENYLRTAQITQSPYQNIIYLRSFDSKAQRIRISDYTETTAQNFRPIAHQVKNGNVFATLVQSSYLIVRVYDPTFIQIGSANYYGAYGASTRVALGSYADSSAIAFFEQNFGILYLVGRYLDSKGLSISNNFVLGPCYDPKAVNIANDLVFVTCFNSDGLQGFGIDKAQQKIIPQFTVCPTPSGVDTSHDLASSRDGKRIISHYITTSNDAYFKIFDENGVQLGKEIKSNVNSGVSIPLATISPNGTFIGSFVRGGLGYGRTFQVNNTSPVLGPLPSTNLTIGDLYTTQLSATDAEGDPLTFSSSNLPDSATLTSQGLFKWTAVSGEQGLHKISFSVSDGFGGSDSGVSISNVLNRPPVPSSISPRNFTANVPLSFRLPFIDPDGDLVNCKAMLGRESLPLWALCVSESNACILTGTPQLQDVGPFPVTFTGNDPYGGFASIIGDFLIVSPSEHSSSVNYSQGSLITLIAGIVGISGTILGFVYRARQQQIDSWCKKHIQPCYIAADQKARACMRHVLCLGKTTSDRTVPLINSNESDA